MTEEQFTQMRDECIAQVMRAAEEFKAVLLDFQFDANITSKDDTPLNNYIQELGYRVYNVLCAEGIKTVGDLLNYEKTHGLKALYFHRNFGKKSMFYVREFLEHYKTNKL